jgi:hypothetical protein
VEIPPRGRTAFDPLEAPRRGPSTVYDPSEMAALRDNVLRLEKLVQDLQDRLDALEGKGAAAAPRLAPPADNPPGNVAPLP